MWKVIRTTITRTKGGKTSHKVIDPAMEKFKIMVLRMMFAIAHLLKISPKALAKTYMGTKPDEYAEKFDDEVIKIGVDERKKSAEALAKDLNG